VTLWQAGIQTKWLDRLVMRQETTELADRLAANRL